MRPTSPKKGGAGEGSLTMLKTMPTATPVKRANVKVPSEGIALCKVMPPLEERG